MLRVGLTGGIGSGKSTVAQRFRQLGAVVIDADQLAREVVAPGSGGLAQIRGRFGDSVMAPDGSLDRAALGEIVFSDTPARRDLEAITHPLIAARTRSLMASAAPEQVVVHDVPLLVELEMAAAYHLTVVVGADDDRRTARLTGDRGLTEVDARARIKAQASDRERRAAADVWLDNNGTVEDLLVQVDALWHDRMVPFNANLIAGSASVISTGLGAASPRAGSAGIRPAGADLVAYDDLWPLAAARLIQRVRRALGERAAAVGHIGPTSMPGEPAPDVIDLQVGVRSLADADLPPFVQALANQGFPRSQPHDPANQDQDAERLHTSADPGRPARLHVREHGSAAWEAAP
jgi:dephospho-CoA kinase